jgi:uncharacterized protein YbjQ (UPF0145 family)
MVKKKVEEALDELKEEAKKLAKDGPVTISISSARKQTEDIDPPD